MMKAVRTWFCAFALLLPGSAAAADSGFAGAAACQGCHPAQAASQALSGHARALSRAGQHPLAQNFETAQPLRGPGPFQHSYTLEDGKLWVSVRGADQAQRLLADWAFGGGDQAVTFVGQADERNHVEFAWTYYSALSGMGPTPGHQALEPETADEALGVHYRTFSPGAEILRCFGCHSTGELRLAEGFKVEPAELGVRCEACHGPGKAHIAAAQTGATAAIERIRNPGKMSAEQQATFCGECHRPPASTDDAVDYRDPWNVRHQPVYLSQSKCFKASEKLSCTLCHDPHQPLERSSAHYDARCSACHTGSGQNAACKAGQARRCATCHMPQVRPQDGLTFHNHWIGVYPPGEVLMPSRRAGEPP